MTGCRRPVLIVEGLGDKLAVPILVRRVFYEKGIYDFEPCSRPLMGVEITKLLRPGQFERFVGYAVQREGDCVLLTLDCEDLEPKTVLQEFRGRLRHLGASKRVEMALFTREFETLFIHCLADIRAAYPNYGWINAGPGTPNPELVRGAKEFLSKQMSRGYAYKESRDQPKFVNAVSLQRLREVSASFLAFEGALVAMYKG